MVLFLMGRLGRVAILTVKNWRRGHYLRGCVAEAAHLHRFQMKPGRFWVGKDGERERRAGHAMNQYQ